MSEVFKYSNGDQVKINASDERGEILGRCEYKTSQNQYYIRYKAGDGRAVESWWGEDAIGLLQSESTA